MFGIKLCVIVVSDGHLDNLWVATEVLYQWWSSEE